MFNTYERVITSTQDVENRLTDIFRLPPSFSFGEKLNLIRNRVPADIRNHLHTLRKERNNIAHDNIHRFNRFSFEEALHAVRGWLREKEMGSPLPFNTGPASRVRDRYEEVQLRRENRELRRNLKSERNIAKGVGVSVGIGLAALGIAKLISDD